MTTKKIFSFLLVILLIFSFSACGKKNETENSVSSNISSSSSATDSSKDNINSTESDTVNKGSTPLLYKVTDDKGNYIWLFGSIHVGKDYFYPLPEYVTSAFDSADSLAVEADIIAFEKDIKSQIKLLQPFVYTDGTKTKDHLSQELYNDAKNAMKDLKVYNFAMNYYKPVLWWNMIETTLYEKVGADSNLGIDRHLLNLAYKNKKTIHSIESAEMQYYMLANFSDELQVFLLENAVEMHKDIPEFKKQIEDMMEVWAEGNEKKLIDTINSEVDTKEFTKKELKLYNEYTEQMATTRNIGMTVWAENALKSGEKVFICVGSAHVVGKDSISDLLSKKGYSVEIVK